MNNIISEYDRDVIVNGKKILRLDAFLKDHLFRYIETNNIHHPIIYRNKQLNINILVYMNDNMCLVQKNGRVISKFNVKNTEKGIHFLKGLINEKV